jgi:hypothetical protein
MYYFYNPFQLTEKIDIAKIKSNFSDICDVQANIGNVDYLMGYSMDEKQQGKTIF